MHIVSPSLSFTSVLLLIVTLTSSHAFSVTPSFSQLRRHKSSTKLRVFFGNDEYHNDEDDYFDLEKAREQLEALVGAEEDSPLQQLQQTVPSVRSPSYAQNPLPALDVELPPAPPLTTIERERREVEIQLLWRLSDGDDSVSDLWTLWFGERGSTAASQLVQADDLTNQGPAHWQQAEDILQGLIGQHGVYWVEPVNRLATLYYMQGRLEEAETLCQIVLAVKPWHFGALSGIVMIYAAQADSDKARRWAASRLPTFAPTGANRRRMAWAEKAVQSAKQALENAEKRVQDLFGEPDDYSALTDTNGEFEEDAWQ